MLCFRLGVKKTTSNWKSKKPASPFFVFMEQFKEQFQEANPNNKSIAAIGKAGGVKWKAMSDSEKASYVAEADKRKIEYGKNMAAYNKKRAVGGNDVDSASNNFKSGVNNWEFCSHTHDVTCVESSASEAYTTYQRLPIEKYEEDESTHPPIGMDLRNLTNRGKTNGIKYESHNLLDPDFVMTGSLSVSSPSTEHSSTVARHDEGKTKSMTKLKGKVMFSSDYEAKKLSHVKDLAETSVMERMAVQMDKLYELEEKKMLFIDKSYMDPWQRAEYEAFCNEIREKYNMPRLG